MRKETATYQRLQEIIAKEGCPICGLCQQAVTGYLDTLLWESSNDLNMAQILTKSLGLCGRHSRELLNFGGQRLAVAVVERTALLAAIRRLPDLAGMAAAPAPARIRLFKVKAPEVGLGQVTGIEPCPACVRERHEETRGIEVLLEHLVEFSDALLAAGGLCLPHFVQTARPAKPRDRELLLALEQRVWKERASYLEEFIRKHMDHHHADPISEPARLAVERTIAGLTGEYPVR
jgi:hypothetical protein